jgi:Carboxypeptidase regulatory-like domain
MKRSRLVLAALAVLALASWRAGTWLVGEDEAVGDPAPAPGGGNRPVERGARSPAEARGRGGAWVPPRLDGAVTISGTVVDAATHEGVGGVEVVFRGDAGEETTTAGPDGRYRIDVPPGAYRAFVRDETVLSVGYADHVRLPGLPTADAANAPDEALMPVVAAGADADGVDLTVTRGGVVRGKVVDRSGRPIASAVLRAVSSHLRPALGTDVAETGADGAFELRLPAGTYDLDVSHARFAGIAGSPDERMLSIEPGEIRTATYTLVAGCVIAGRVVGAGGGPAGDGAIELQYGPGDSDFLPAGRIAADGTFRWATTAEDDVVLRAWPWKSPPSPPRTFACRDGARHDGIVFTLTDRGPDLDGVLVDRGGAPVPLAYIDLMSLDGGTGQQERTDEQGRWSVFELPAGRYQVTAYAPGRGVLATTITAPQAQVRLTLGGTGRIEGRTPRLARGSFQLSFQRCHDGEVPVRLPAEQRLVTVVDHAFVVEDVPACDLRLATTWRGRMMHATAAVPAGGTAHVELAVGPPLAKVVRGTVTDEAGRPAPGATVKAWFEHDPPTSATTDAAGRYTLRTFVGANIIATKEDGGRLYAADGTASEEEGDETIDLELSVVDTQRPDGFEEE